MSDSKRRDDEHTTAEDRTNDDGTFFRRPGFPTLPPSWAGSSVQRPGPEEGGSEPDRDDADWYEEQQYDTSGSGSWIDEGLITLLLVAGVVLLLFPEPATSGLGLLLLVAGLIGWLLDWAT